MFQAKDGKKFGSSFAGKNYDEKHSPDGMHRMGEEKESPAEDQGENETPETNQQDEQRPDEESEDTVHPMVSEHGKAHSCLLYTSPSPRD